MRVFKHPELRLENLTHNEIYQKQVCCPGENKVYSYATGMTKVVGGCTQRFDIDTKNPVIPAHSEVVEND